MPATSASGSTSNHVKLPYRDRMDLIFGFIIYALLFAVAALTFYWIIRKAVAGGIRDAQVDEARRRS